MASETLKMNFLLGWPNIQGLSFREGNPLYKITPILGKWSISTRIFSKGVGSKTNQNHPTHFFRGLKSCCWFRNSANPVVYPVIYQGFTHPNGGWPWDFWTINGTVRSLEKACDRVWRWPYGGPRGWRWNMEEVYCVSIQYILYIR